MFEHLLSKSLRVLRLAGLPGVAGVTGILAGSLAAHAAVTPLLDEDFQADAATQRPAATSQFVTYCRPASGDTATSKIHITDGSPDVCGPFKRIGNLSLYLYAQTGSDTPSMFIRNQLSSGVTSTNDGGFSARVFIPQAAGDTATPILKFSIGRDTSGNSALSTSEQVAQVDFLGNGRLQIRTGSGIYSSDQTYNFGEIHTLAVQFTTGAAGLFSVTLDDQPVTVSGNGSFAAQSATTDINAVFVLAQGDAALATAAYVDNVFLVDGQGVTYYVAPAPTGSDSYAGTDPAYPLANPNTAVNRAGPGDTVVIADGLYRQGLGSFSTSATPSTRITVRGASASQGAVLTTMEDLSDPAKWTEVAGHPHVYVHNGVNEIPGDSSVPLFRHVTQDGRTLRIMAPDESMYGSPADLSGPGQWSRNYATGDLYVWAFGGENPGLSATEASRKYCTVFLKSNDSGPGANYITLRDLSFEGSYYTLSIGGNYSEVIHCKISNTYADLIKAEGHATHCLVEDSNFFNMGESAIDDCYCDYWTIRGNYVHDAWSNRIYGTKANGFMLKYGVQHVLVENNILSNLDTRFGAIGIGGSSDGSPAIEGRYITVRNNIIEWVTGPYIVAFTSAQDCTFTGNTIRWCRASRQWPYSSNAALILWASNDGAANTHPSLNNTITNNIFFDPAWSSGQPYNESTYTYAEYAPGNCSGTVSGNVVNPAWKDLIHDAYGVAQEVSSSYFPDDLDPN